MRRSGVRRARARRRCDELDGSRRRRHGVDVIKGQPIKVRALASRDWWEGGIDGVTVSERWYKAKPRL